MPSLLASCADEAVSQSCKNVDFLQVTCGKWRVWLKIVKSARCKPSWALLHLIAVNVLLYYKSTHDVNNSWSDVREKAAGFSYTSRISSDSCLICSTEISLDWLCTPSATVANGLILNFWSTLTVQIYVQLCDSWCLVFCFSLSLWLWRRSQTWRCSCEYMTPPPPSYQQISPHISPESSSPLLLIFLNSIPKKKTFARPCTSWHPQNFLQRPNGHFGQD